MCKAYYEHATNRLIHERQVDISLFALDLLDHFTCIDVRVRHDKNRTLTLRRIQGLRMFELIQQDLIVGFGDVLARCFSALQTP